MTRLQNEHGPDADPTADLRRNIIFWLVAISAVVAAFYTVYHLLSYQPIRAAASLSAVAAAGLLAVVLRLTRSHRPAVMVATSYAALVTLGLLASDGFPAGDFVWCFVVPPLIAYAGGREFARWLLPLYLVAATVVVLRPGFAHGETWTALELHARFLGLLVLVSAVAYLYELTRSRAHDRLRAEIEERRAAQRELARVNERLSEAAHEATQLADQAQAASLSKTRFLSQMSHDIRTPLTGIVGMTSVLELTQMDDEQRSCLETIRSSGEALSELIGDILDLAAIDAGRIEPRLVPLDTKGFLDDLRRVLSPQAHERGIRLECERNADLPRRLLADPARLRQIVLNLAGNALKFTPRGSVTVRFAPKPKDARWWRIEVQDTGIGIAPDQHRRIFDSFTQVELPEGKRRGGIGLGLAICSRLVALLGGELGLESEQGAGSRFWVDLPLTQVNEGEAGARPPRSELPRLPALQLLVVDDNEIVRQVLAGMLRQDGHSVELATDGAMALDRLDLGSFDAVLMDVQMPNLDGIETTRRLRSREGGSSESVTPVIAVTALADAGTRQACLDAGMNAVLTKPVQRGALVSALAGVTTAPRASAEPPR